MKMSSWACRESGNSHVITSWKWVHGFVRVRESSCQISCFKLFAHTFLLPLGYYRSAMYENESTSPFKLAVECELHNQHSSFWCSVDGALLDRGGDKVEGMEVTADEGGVTHTRGGYQWFILPAGCKNQSDQIHNLSTSDFLSEPDCLGPKCVRFCLHDMSVPLGNIFQKALEYIVPLSNGIIQALIPVNCRSWIIFLGYGVGDFINKFHYTPNCCCTSNCFPGCGPHHCQECKELAVSLFWFAKPWLHLQQKFAAKGHSELPVLKHVKIGDGRKSTSCSPLHIVVGFWTTLCWTLSSQTYFPTWVHSSCQNLSDFPLLVGWCLCIPKNSGFSDFFVLVSSKSSFLVFLFLPLLCAST